jgi:beta-exotoxin I transport system ATP-binding protein
MPVIETHELSKHYGELRAVERVSLQVQAGEVFGFLGPNGAGKTTTMRMLLDLLRPTSGTASIFGLDAHRHAPAIRARLGNLPGDYAYDPRLTGREIVAYFARLRGMRGIGRAGRLAERFEADLDRPLGKLSRGNRQKIGLIQATFHEPELLLLDEPTSSLDPLMQDEFLRFVAEERQHGVTVFISSHELDEVEHSCDRVGIIRAGALVAVEDVEAITRRSFKHVAIEFVEPVDPAAFERIEGVHDMRRQGERRISFKVTGDLDGVIKAAARYELADIDLTSPTLEEIVLTYYGRGETT